MKSFTVTFSGSNAAHPKTIMADRYKLDSGGDLLEFYADGELVCAVAFLSVLTVDVYRSCDSVTLDCGGNGQPYLAGTSFPAPRAAVQTLQTLSSVGQLPIENQAARAV